MDSIISTFHIDWKIIIAQAFNFAVVFVVLYIFALKPLTKMMAERSGKIHRGLEDAKINAGMLAKTKEEYDTMLRKAKEEASKIAKEGKKENEAEKARMLESARSEADKIIGEGKKSLEAEKNKIVEEAKKEIAILAMLAAEKVIKEKN